MSFFEELKRRNVVKVGIAYVLMGWVVLQLADFALDLIVYLRAQWRLARGIATDYW